MILAALITWVLFFICEFSFRSYRDYRDIGYHHPDLVEINAGTAIVTATAQTVQFAAIGFLVLWCLGKSL